MSAQYTFTQFTPGEAERITGVTTVNQRNWRRWEFLPKAEGHARFDAFALAEMWVLKLLSDRGIGPQLGKEVASICAAGIMWEILRDHSAYEGDHERALEWYPDAMKPRFKTAAERRADMLSVTKSLNPDLTEADFDKIVSENGITFCDGTEWGEKGEWLARQIMRLKGFRFVPASYFVWWADGTHVWCGDLNNAFSEQSHADPRAGGPVVVLNLSSLGWQLHERLGRPVVHVEFETDPETGRILGPLEYGTPVPFLDNSEREAPYPENGDHE